MIPEDYDQLRRERDMAEHYLNISGALILTLDVNGHVRLINKTGEKMLGYGEGELDGADWFEVACPKEFRAKDRAEFDAYIADPPSDPVVREREVLTKTGERIFVRWTDTAVRAAAGSVISMLSAGTDLTAEKKVEAALRESTARLEDFSDAASDWLWEMDSELRFSYFSPGLFRIIGTPLDKLIGKTRTQMLAKTNLTPSVREQWDAHLKDLADHIPFHDFEYERTKSDGTLLYVRVSGKPIFDDQGAFKGYRGTGREVTNEVMAKQSALQAQELLMNTIDNVPTMMALFDNQDRFVMCNQAYREALSPIRDLLVPGITFEDIARISAQRGLAAGYEDDPEEWVRVRMARFRELSDPVVHQQLDGRWVMTTDLRTPDGGTLIMRTDISPIKEAEEKLRANEEMLHTFLDAMTDPAALIDREANFILSNRAMAMQHGVDPQDLIGRPMFRDPPTEVGKQRRAWIDEVIRTGTALQRRDYFEGRWSEMRITPVFGTKGEVVQIAIVARDITKDVNKDALLRKMSQATEQSADLVVVTNVQGDIEYVNQQFTKRTGYTAEEVLGKNPRILASGATDKAIYKDLWNTVLSGNSWRGELQDRCKDGTTFWAAITIAPILDADGTIVNFVSSHVDISERKATEDALNEAVLRTEIANRAKGELLANMSHELRTPLNAIIGFSSMMNEGVYGPIANPQYEEYTKIITSSATHLLDIINDILDVSAIEAGKLKLNEELFGAEDNIASTLSLIEHRASEGVVDVALKVTPQNAVLFADARRFKQIVLNLVSNAVKFTQKGGSVQVDYSVNADGCPFVSVTDTGIGMNAAEIQVALSQFGQADSSHARKYEGTGLGLPLTLGLVEMHGGTMDIKSTVGSGTTVLVTFPKEREKSGA